MLRPSRGADPSLLLPFFTACRFSAQAARPPRAEPTWRLRLEEAAQAGVEPRRSECSARGECSEEVTVSTRTEGGRRPHVADSEEVRRVTVRAGAGPQAFFVADEKAGWLWLCAGAPRSQEGIGNRGGDGWGAGGRSRCMPR